MSNVTMINNLNQTTCIWNNGIDGYNMTNLDCIKLSPKNMMLYNLTLNRIDPIYGNISCHANILFGLSDNNNKTNNNYTNFTDAPNSTYALVMHLG
jgi:hypothetical protein